MLQIIQPASGVQRDDSGLGGGNRVLVQLHMPGCPLHPPKGRRSVAVIGGPRSVHGDTHCSFQRGLRVGGGAGGTEAGSQSTLQVNTAANLTLFLNDTIRFSVDMMEEFLVKIQKMWLEDVEKCGAE